MNRKTDIFLNQYRELEAAVSAQYGLQNSDSAVGFLLRLPEWSAMRGELELCREVRNLLTHNPKVRERYPVEPSDEMIALLERAVERVKNPLRAKHIFIPKEKVLCRTLQDLVRPAMTEMGQRLYSHIPIVKDGVVLGVFSENTLLNYLIDSEGVGIDSNTRFQDIADYLPLKRHKAESYRFVGRNTPVSELEEMFAAAAKKRDRIGLVFVTNSGNPGEKLLGIISAWDMAGVD